MADEQSTASSCRKQKNPKLGANYTFCEKTLVSWEYAQADDGENDNERRFKVVILASSWANKFSGRRLKFCELRHLAIRLYDLVAECPRAPLLRACTATQGNTSDLYLA